MIEGGRVESVKKFSDCDAYINELFMSSEGLINPELRERIKATTLLVAGAGSVGNPVATLATRIGFQHIMVADPDQVEISNLPRQEYDISDLKTNKAEATGRHLKKINPHAYVTVIRQGIIPENVRPLVDKATFIVDAIDVSALDMMWELHKEAKRQGKIVITGFDMAGTAVVVIYRYDNPDSKILNGALREQDISKFRQLKTTRNKGEISENDFLQEVYRLVSKQINPLDVPIEQLREILKTSDRRKIPQLGTTARLLSVLILETVIAILDNKKVHSTITVDLPTLVQHRKFPNTQISKLYYLYLVMRKLRT